MSGEVEPEPRASHEDRERVVERLKDAAGDGRLDLEELDERVGSALSARTTRQLAVLVADLQEAPGAHPARAKDVVRIEVTGSNAVREGPWIVPRTLEVQAHLGNVRLDLTSAVLSHPDLQIVARMHLGNLTIITRPGIEIDTDGVAITFGSVKVESPPAAEPGGTPLRVEVTGSIEHSNLRAHPPRPPRRGFLTRLLRRPHP